MRYKNGCGLSAITSPGANAADYPANPSGIPPCTCTDVDPCADTGVICTWAMDPADWGDNDYNTANRGFIVYRDAIDVSGKLPASTLFFNDNTGINNTLYNYYVSALNACDLYADYSSMDAQDQVGEALLVSHTLSIDDTSGNSNNVWDENETVAIQTAWSNEGTGTAQAVTGTATSMDPVNITDAAADYGDIAAGASASCTDTADCYAGTATGPRPATHWDVTVHEELSTTDSHDWILHVGNSFTDVPDSALFYYFIETLLHSGVTAGCTATQYCPMQTVQRQHMAKFICTAMEATTPGSCTTSPCTEIFQDVPATNIFCPHIEALYNAGIVSGCNASPLLYCPGMYVTREQMAKYIVNAFGFILY